MDCELKELVNVKVWYIEAEGRLSVLEVVSGFRWYLCKSVRLFTFYVNHGILSLKENNFPYLLDISLVKTFPVSIVDQKEEEEEEEEGNKKICHLFFSSLTRERQLSLGPPFGISFCCYLNL